MDTWHIYKVSFLIYYTDQISPKMIKQSWNVLLKKWTSYSINNKSCVDVKILLIHRFPYTAICQTGSDTIHLSDRFRHNSSSNTMEILLNMCVCYPAAEHTNYAVSFGSSNKQSCFCTKIYNFLNPYKCSRQTKAINWASWLAGMQ